MRRHLGWRIPARKIEVKPRVRALRIRCGRTGQRGEQFSLGRSGRRTDPEGLGDGAPAGERECLGLSEIETRQPRAIAINDAYPAAVAGFGIDRNAGFAQLLDVPVDRAHGNAELSCELRGTHVPAQLQEQLTARDAEVTGLRGLGG